MPLNWFPSVFISIFSGILIVLAVVQLYLDVGAHHKLVTGCHGLFLFNKKVVPVQQERLLDQKVFGSIWWVYYNDGWPQTFDRCLPKHVLWLFCNKLQWKCRWMVGSRSLPHFRWFCWRRRCSGWHVSKHRGLHSTNGENGSKSKVKSMNKFCCWKNTSIRTAVSMVCHCL